MSKCFSKKIRTLSSKNYNGILTSQQKSVFTIVIYSVTVNIFINGIYMHIYVYVNLCVYISIGKHIYCIYSYISIDKYI